MDKPLVCDLCKKENETLFLITILSVGEKWLCPQCYLKMLPEPDRTRSDR